MKRRIICLAIVMVLLCAMFAVPALAAQCYITKTNVAGTWYMYWWQSYYPSGAIGYPFYPTYPETLKNIIANGHAHTGTLTSYTSVDPGPELGPISYKYIDGYRCYYYPNSTATYYGYLTCVN